MDDDEAIVTMIELLIEHAVPDAAVDSFTDPVNAVRAFEANPSAYSMVITGIMMPGMHGTEVIARIRAIRPAVRLLVVSGQVGGGHFDAAHWDVIAIPKPFTAEELIRAIRLAMTV